MMHRVTDPLCRYRWQWLIRRGVGRLRPCRACHPTGYRVTLERMSR